MLKSEDAIAHVASAIMEADWKWNPDYRSKKGTVRTKRAYRNQRAIWAIQGWIANNKRKPNTISLSYESDNGEHSTSLTGLIADKKSYNPSNIAADKDELNHTKQLINALLVSGAISDKQREYITAYYLEGKTLQEVGKQFGVTREAVRQCINCGIKTLTELI
jgi:RNA polymerase sigma factor (sigma-70 family)